MKLPLFFFLLLVSNLAFSCSDLNWNWTNEEWASKSEKIYVGVVLSDRLVNVPVEKYVNQYDLGGIVLWGGERKISIRVLETLKGRKQKNITAVLHECIGGSESVFVSNQILLFYVSGVWHAKSRFENETSKYVYGSLSNRKTAF